MLDIQRALMRADDAPLEMQHGKWSRPREAWTTKTEMSFIES